MKREFTLLVLVLGLMFTSTQIGFGQLSGPLNGTLGPGHYTVAAEISVDEGNTLTLVPPATLDFLGPYPFRIRGVLLAQGTESDSITFTTAQSGLSRWRGLDFLGSGSSGSQLAYCLIENGLAPDSGYPWRTGGGGVYCDSASPSFTHCMFRGDSATVYGGGVFCVNHASPNFSNCLFINNYATYGGGGAVGCRESSLPSFVNCIFSGNSGAHGGGVFCHSGCPATLTNCTFSNNSATWGGGFWCQECSPNLTNCTLSGNSANTGGAVCCWMSGLRLTNSVVAFSNSFGIFFGVGASGAQVRYCDIYGNTQGVFQYWFGPEDGPPGIGELVTENTNGDPVDAYMNIYFDPHFVDRLAGDFHLTNWSRCLGAGDPTNLPPIDFEGDPRPDPAGSYPDIGIDEHPAAAPSPSGGHIELISATSTQWAYRVHWISGVLSHVAFTNLCPGTTGAVAGDALVNGWSVNVIGLSAIFSASTPLTSGVVDTLWLFNDECGGELVTWTVGDSSGVIEGPLPVELMSFTAIEGDRQIMLRWETASETDNDYFEIRRDAVLVAQMESEGNSTSGHEYSWTDREVENGVTYEYTLTAVDMSGVQEEIGVLNATPQADAPTVTEYALAQNYPNPFNASTEIRYAIPEAGHVTLTVFNAMGQVVATLVDADQVTNNYHVEFDASHLSTGIYLYRLEVNEFAAVNKMVLLR